MTNTKNIIFVVPNIFSLKTRLDIVLSRLFYNYSRTCLKNWILNHQVNVNGRTFNKPSIKVSCGDLITINVIKSNDQFYNAQNIHLNVVYEDNDILVINKQSNLVVHPGAGNKDGTLLNALLYKDEKFLSVPRSGIVHRLDKNTTGLMVIAKNVISYNNLIKLMKSKNIIRKYEAIVHGRIISGGTIDRCIKRHPIKRVVMTTSISGKSAITHYRIIKRFFHYTHLAVKLETGRTHQIRVHMLSINHPLVGDNMYGNKYKFHKKITSDVLKVVKNFPRQALHASKLRLKHPITGLWMEWNSTLPKDILDLLNCLNVNDDTNKN
ncbi:MAG: 23S rRNA pseudouridine(1911/1915/1917) synthase RluD [Buchnera aphidicola (Floraphis choui)]